MEKRKILPLPGIEPRPPNLKLVAIPTELSSLLRRNTEERIPKVITTRSITVLEAR
jgi:hypothetical protein